MTGVVVGTGNVALDRTRRQLWFAALGTPALAAVGWLLAWYVATLLPGVPTWDGTFTWAPLLLMLILPAFVVLPLLGLPAWVRPHDARALRLARTLVLVGCQAVVVFVFGFCPEWWRTGGFPPTVPVGLLELAAAALALVPSLLLVLRRDDGSSRGWRAYAMVAPAFLVVLAVVVTAAIVGVPPFDPYALVG